jgi:two-component system nitrate/nitrite sensor histidine kinase NarX
VLTSIRAKLSAVFIGFLLIGAGSVAATFLTVRAQTADARVINLAGRERMLVQEITKAVLGIAQERPSDYQTELRQAADLFDRTLVALLDGGSVAYGDETVTLPPTTDTNIRAQLEQVTDLWGQFRRQVEAVQTAEAGTVSFAQAVSEIESLTPVILEEIDQAVRMYETSAEQKVARLRAIQAIFFASAIALLLAGYFLTQRTIVKPISALEAVTRRIASGDLESSTGIEPAGSDEVRALAHSFESMCQELAISQVELERWAAELEMRVERRTEQLAALFEISAEISSKLDIQRVLDLVVEKTRHLAGGEVAVLCLHDPSDDSLTVAATSGSAEAFAARPPAVIPGFAPGAGCTGETAVLHEGCDCALLQAEFRRSHLAVPLRTGGRILGMLCVGHREEGRFGEEETRLLTLLANASAAALENARLYEQAERAATLAERERIVAEIHDSLAQTLSFLRLRLNTVEELIQAEDLAEVPEQLTLMQRIVEQTSHEVRRMMTGLQTSAQTRSNLEEQVRGIVERFGREQGMEIELRVEDEPPIRGAQEVYEQVVRVVQEALTNVNKHANSSRATITLGRDGGQAIARVQDDGPGFDVNAPANGQHPFDKLRTPHFGLKVMKVRAERIGGELSVESAPGQGTTITLRWPIAEE